MQVEQPLSSRYLEIRTLFTGGSSGRPIHPVSGGKGNNTFDITEAHSFKLNIIAPRPGGVYRVEIYRQTRSRRRTRRALDKIILDDHTTSNHR